MKVKRFSEYSHDQDGNYIEDPEYIKFLESDGISVKIRHIIYNSNNSRIIIYYDEIQKQAVTANRFSDLEVV